MVSSVDVEVVASCAVFCFADVVIDVVTPCVVCFLDIVTDVVATCVVISFVIAAFNPMLSSAFCDLKDTDVVLGVIGGSVNSLAEQWMINYA